MLSHRSVVFVNGQVYFRCRRCDWAEVTIDDESPSVTNQENYSASFLAMALEPEAELIVAYQLFLQYFSRHKLTYESDAVNTIAGLARRISARMQCPMIDGLPAATLDAVLLFSAHRHQLERREVFPSCSWAGWMGEIS
jgi:hypothetical protein